MNLDEQHLQEAVKILKTLLTAIGAGLLIWGTFNLIDGIENGDEEQQQYGLELILRSSRLTLLSPQLRMLCP